MVTNNIYNINTQTEIYNIYIINIQIGINKIYNKYIVNKKHRVKGYIT